MPLPVVLTWALTVLALSSDDPRSQLLIPLAFAALMFAALALGKPRVQRGLIVATAPLFRGAALLVSLAAVGLAALRVNQVDYVTTLLDGTPGTTLLAYLAFGYLATVSFDYWVRRQATERMNNSLISQR